HAGGQDRVGAQAALVFRAVQVDQGAVDEGLFLRIQTHQGFGNFGVDVLDGTQHALAQVAGLVAVAQFDGFARTGGRARGHRSPPHGARFEQHVAFHGGVAARIEDFASDDVYDCTHGLTVLPV